MLSIRRLRVAGRHSDLVPPTSFEVRPGELVLVHADGQESRTALALVATGRLAPTEGTAVLDSPGRSPRADLKALRAASTIADAPAINAPELHLKVRDLVAEDLALLPRRARSSARPSTWLSDHGFSGIADAWADDLPAARRIELATALALADPATKLLVLDSPDRHSDDPDAWLPFLAATAASGTRPLAVVATVATLPESWRGPAAVVGNSLRRVPAEGDAGATDGDVDPARGDLDVIEEVLA